MLKHRFQLTLQVNIDQDFVPGFGHNAEDYVKHIQNILNQTVAHYHPVVTVIKIEDEPQK